MPVDDAGGRRLDLAVVLAADRPQAVQRLAERVHHPADQGRAHRHLEYAGGASHLVALPQLEVVTQDDRAEVVFLEIQGEAGHRFAGLGGRELQHLARHRGFEAVDTGRAVFHLEDGAHLLDIERTQVGSLDLPEKNVLQLAGSEDRISSHGIQSGRCL